MSFLLCNHNDHTRRIGLSNFTWYGILQMAEDNGWIPMGTVNDHQSVISDPAPLVFMELPDWLPGEYWDDETRLVLFEDALNLADALEIALTQYKPQFLPCLSVFALQDSLFNGSGSQPSIGALRLIADFCLLGSFSIVKV